MHGNGHTRDHCAGRRHRGGSTGASCRLGDVAVWGCTERLQVLKTGADQGASWSLIGADGKAQAALDGEAGLVGRMNRVVQALAIK